MIKATIKEIARKPGVSVSTVSGALCGHPDISEDSRPRVESLARELNCHTSTLTRSLQHKQTQVIGVILSHLVAGLLISVAVTTHPCDHFVRLKNKSARIRPVHQKLKSGLIVLKSA